MYNKLLNIITKKSKGKGGSGKGSNESMADLLVNEEKN